MAETIFYLFMTIQLIYGFMAGRRKGIGGRKTEIINSLFVVFLFLMNVAPAHQFYGLTIELFNGPSEEFRALMAELNKPVGVVPGWAVVADFWGSVCVSLILLLEAILLARRDERARKSILVLFPIACLSAILSFLIGFERAREGHNDTFSSPTSFGIIFSVIALCIFFQWLLYRFYTSPDAKHFFS